MMISGFVHYRITDAYQVRLGCLKQKCRHNLPAIELLQRLDTEARPPTEDEKRILGRYIGWGGLPQVSRVVRDIFIEPVYNELQRFSDNGLVNGAEFL